MTVIWSGVTEEGAVVPVQVTAEGKVVAVGDGPEGDYLKLTGGNLTGDLTLGALPAAPKISLNASGTSEFKGNMLVNGRVDSSAGVKVTRVDASGGYLSIGNSSSNCYSIHDGTKITSKSYYDGTLQIGGVLNSPTPGQSTPEISLNADGSASFGGGKSQIVGGPNSPSILGNTAYNAFTVNALDGATFATINYRVSSNPQPADLAFRVSGWNDDNTFAHATYAINHDGTVSIGPNVSPSAPDQSGTKIKLSADGRADFAGDVIIGSRGEQWLIRESNGVAMLVQQTLRGEQPIMESLRDLPNELDLIEAALNEVMYKLRMTPPAGWPVWDGQSEVTTDNHNA